MIDWREIGQAESADELKQAKRFLFQESIRLEQEQTELRLLKGRIVQEQKRLKQDAMFFDKKMMILENGFRELEADRQKFNREKEKFKREKLAQSRLSNSDNIAEVLFRNVNNPLALRKRYRDLVKIFHPDNLSGDEELVQLINREFSRRRREE